MKRLMKSLLVLGGLSAICYYVVKKVQKIIGDKENKIKKFKNYYNVLNQWFQIKNNGRSLEEYFINNDYSNIAVYGMGELGCRLLEEFEKSSVNVSYAIDKEANNRYSNVKVLSMNEKLDVVDCIVVTPIFDYDTIKVALEEKTMVPIISLEDVVYECSYQN